MIYVIFLISFIGLYFRSSVFEYIYKGMSNVHLLFAVMCAAAALVLAASEVTSSLARPRMRRRDHLKQQPEIEEPPLRVRALPRDVTLYPRSSVSVKCRVRVASWALNSLLIGFYVSHF